MPRGNNIEICLDHFGAMPFVRALKIMGVYTGERRKNKALVQKVIAKVLEYVHRPLYIDI